MSDFAVFMLSVALIVVSGMINHAWIVASRARVIAALGHDSLLPKLLKWEDR